MAYVAAQRKLAEAGRVGKHKPDRTLLALGCKGYPTPIPIYEAELNAYSAQ